MSETIGREAAEQELREIELVFDATYTADEREKILEAIMAGRIISDSGKETIEYMFVKPIKLMNSETAESITIKNPSYLDIEYINKEFTVRADGSGGAEFDYSKLQRKAIRAVTRLSGLPMGVAERISRKDMRVLAALLNFFD